MEQKHITNPVEFKGKGGEFFGIWIVNVLLTIITLGIYSAWAKVRTKRYFYGNTYVDSDNFEYHAEPMQILKGRLVAVAVLVIWAVANAFFPAASAALLLVFYIALPWLLWSNARFDAAMTSYRNVHFSFDSSLKDAYVALMGRGLGALLAIAIYIGVVVAVSSVSAVAATVLGIASLVFMAVLYAWVVAGAHKYFSNGYRYGDWKFSAELETGFFFKTYLKAIGLGIVASIVLLIVMSLTVFSGFDFTALQNGDFSSLMGVSQVTVFIVAYLAIITLTIGLTAYTTTRLRNYIFDQLQAKLEQESDNQYTFESSLTARGYTWLVISNFLLQVVTLSIARPWVMVRTSRYVADNTVVFGDMSVLKATDQDSNVKSAVSDEVAQAFDLGIGIS
ncbi:YjgN family protein [Vibrio coralliilyticus]|uniref:YjgN family protein n=1 Tax=Vibrio coralliilyticus TaxID=190893 RepID=UPI002409820F|nr:YjgN family protein [Vibrio coralliilyticus]WFB47797.1 YjgN family protein [Vibrio coralliilyticus]